MKIYTFLKKPEPEDVLDDTLDLRIKYALYALTTEKKKAKLFKKARNMELFIERVIDVDDDAGDEYLLRNRGHILQHYWIPSFSNKNKDDQSPYWVRILVTENELNFVMETTDTGSILNKISGFVPVEVFTSKIREALFTLKYDKASRNVLAMSIGENRFRRFVDEFPMEDYDFLDLGLSFDSFSIFMILYQKILSVDFFETIEVSYTEPKNEYSVG